MKFKGHVTGLSGTKSVSDLFAGSNQRIKLSLKGRVIPAFFFMLQTLNSLHIAIVTTIIMVIMDGIAYNNGREKRHFHTLEYWFCYLGYFTFSYLTQNYGHGIMAFSTFFWIWRTRTISNILQDVGGEKVGRPWHWILLTIFYGIGVFLYFAGADFAQYTSMAAAGNFIVGLDLINKTRISLSKKPSISPIHKLLLLTVFLIYFHQLNYPFLRLLSMASLGFFIVHLTTILMAVILPAVTIFDLQRDRHDVLENIIKDHAKQLTEQAKFSSLGEMTAGIVHEINNPLSIVIHRSSHLKSQVTRDKHDKEMLLRNLDQIEKTAERMGKIVNSLRKFSKNPEGETLQSVPVSTIIDDTLSYCNDRFYHANVILQVEPTPDIEIECKSVQISQVLLNLLNNSFDAIKNSENPWVKIDFNETPSHLQIKVIDSGLGIPASIRKKIMDPFFTTKAEGGTGLGLSISKQIMDAHQGRLFFDESSKNTAFVMEIPFRQDRNFYSM
jgi:signal transduction histidine kinase